MSKFQVGDTVVVKEDLETDYDLFYNITPFMVGLKGKTFKIKNIEDDYYFLKEDSNLWHESALRLLDKKEEMLKALVGSIHKWVMIKYKGGHDHGIKDCPLCSLYHGEFNSCTDCPIHEKTGQRICDNTPYTDGKPDKDRRMVDFLCDLYNELTDYEKPPEEEQVLKAVVGSIHKWALLYTNRDQDELGIKDCPLCSLFFKEDGGKDKCLGCPIFIETGKFLCKGTPYYEDTSYDNPQRKMVYFLCDLYNKLTEDNTTFKVGQCFKSSYGWKCMLTNCYKTINLYGLPNQKSGAGRVWTINGVEVKDVTKITHKEFMKLYKGAKFTPINVEIEEV